MNGARNLLGVDTIAERDSLSTGDRTDPRSNSKPSVWHTFPDCFLPCKGREQVPNGNRGGIVGRESELLDARISLFALCTEKVHDELVKSKLDPPLC